MPKYRRWLRRCDRHASQIFPKTANWLPQCVVDSYFIGMSTQIPTFCGRCGIQLDPNQLAGLCPRCLAVQNFATDTSAPSNSSKQQELPPSPEVIEVSLPQLEGIEYLGRGGMGIVYKARQKSLGRTVALKLLAPERLHDRDFATRFEREAKALAAMNHPNIVTIYDFGKAGEFYYLLMEFIDGVNLRQAMAASRLSSEQALAIVPPICDALQYAHEHGIVHRDIKPENLLLDKEGRVKIADFGIAKILDTESLADVVESQPAGTPQYMAPEQRLHAQTDHRADIYSLGVVLYEMLTGELPSERLQPPSKQVQIDVRIDEIVLRALEARPELRFSTASEFRASVEAFVETTASQGVSNSSVWRHRNKSNSADASSTHSLSWRMVVGSLLALVGFAVLFGAPIINEVIDDFAMTKTARYYQQELKRASERWSEVNTAVVEAVVALDVVKKTQDAAEISRLTQELESLRKSAAQAESAVNQVALQKEASERERSQVLYFIGGGLIVGGLFVCFRGAKRNSLTETDRDEHTPKIGTSTLVSREELASVWNQWFCYRTRGPLVLDDKTLTHSFAGGTTSIPLEAIRDVSIGRLPRLMNLAGLNVLSISYKDEGETRHVLVSPIEGRFQFSQQAVADWFVAIRKAVVAATGREPSTTPLKKRGIPQSSRLMFALLFIVPTLCLLALYVKYANEARQVATPSVSAAASRGFPVSTTIRGNQHSVLIVHDESEATLDYVFYFPGDILTSSSGTRNPADQTWVDEGVVKLSSGRKFSYSRKAFSPNELQINGENFDLRYGRVFVLHVDGDSEQIPAFPTLHTARDTEAVGRLVAVEHDRKSQLRVEFFDRAGGGRPVDAEHDRERNGLVAYTTPHVMVPEGSHDLILHLRREWEKTPRVGIETSLHIVAGTSPDPAKRMPKNGVWTTRMTGIVKGDEEFDLVLTLPDEIPDARLTEAAANIRQRYQVARLPMILSETEPLRLAELTHPDGWECHLYVRAVKLDEFNRPIEAMKALSESDAKDDPAPPADPVDPTSDLAIKTYDFGFAFTGSGEEARLRDDVRLAIEQFVQKTDAETGRTPDVRMDPDTRILTLTGPPEQQRVIAQIVADLKKPAATEPVPFTAWGEKDNGLQVGLGFRPGEHRVYHPGETVTLVVRLKNVDKDKAKHSYRSDRFYTNPPSVMDGDGMPVAFEGLPVRAKGKGFNRWIDVELTRGVVDLWELKLALRPAAEAGTQRPAWTLFGAGKFQLNYPKTGRLELEVKEPEINTAFTAWGAELGGLQAGIGFRADEKRRVFHPGEKVHLVVRVRNVDKKPILFRHLSHYFLQTPPVVKDHREQPVALKGDVLFSGGKPKLVAHEVAPDREIEVAELTIELQPDSAKESDKTWALRGVGKYIVRYEEIEAVIGPGNGNPNLLLGYMLDTGTLEFEVQEVADAMRSRSNEPAVPSQVVVRPNGEWSTAMLELAQRVSEFRADGLSSPDDLIHWGEPQGGLQAGLLMPGVASQGIPVEARVVLRNATQGSEGQRLELNGKQPMQLVTRGSRNDDDFIRTPSQLLPVSSGVIMTLRPGEQIEFDSRMIQYGGTRNPDSGNAMFVNINPGFCSTKVALMRVDGPALETGKAAVFIHDKFGAHSTVTQTLAFPLRHKLARNMEVALQQLVKGRPIQDCKASPDDGTIYVVAYNDVMRRVRTFIAVNDANDTIVRDDDFNYPTFSPLVTSRSFFHACAIEDDDRAIANLLSLGVLAELKGDSSEQYDKYKKSGVIDAHWADELRDNWPGKREKIRELVSQWNRFALIRLQELQPADALLTSESGIDASFVNAPVDNCLLKVVRSDLTGNDQEKTFCIDSFPPWWPSNSSAKP